MKHSTTDLGQQGDTFPEMDENVDAVTDQDISFAPDDAVDEQIIMGASLDAHDKQQLARQAETQDLPRMSAMEVMLDLNLCETIRLCDKVLSSIPVELPDGIQFNFEAVGEGKTMLVIIAIDCTNEAWESLHKSISKTLKSDEIGFYELSSSVPGGLRSFF